MLSAVIADNITGTKHHSNTELVAQGIANIGSACFGGLPVTGAIARTIANIKAGAKTPIAGIIHAVLILGFMWVFSPIVSLIPLSCLAAILVVIAIDMSVPKNFYYLIVAAINEDRLILLVTFFLTILIDLIVAIEVGLALKYFMVMKQRIKIYSIERKKIS